jgi:hypothetical protein
MRAATALDASASRTDEPDADDDPSDPRRSEERAGRRPRVPDGLSRLIGAPYRLPLGLVYAVSVAFYTWTATSTGDPIVLGKSQDDYYNQLTTAFLHGSVALQIAVPKALAALKDPYDPKANAQWAATFHDMAYYHGHLYLVYGSTAVFTLFMPWRVLHLGDMPQNLAVLIFSSVGLAFMLGCLRFLVRRYLPGARTWKVCLGGFALALSNIAPFLLRRPSVYEIELASAYCFLGMTLYFLAKSCLGDRIRWGLLAWASVGAGLTIVARPDLITIGLLFLVVGVVFVRSGRLPGRAERLKFVGVAFGPLALGFAWLLVYNELRFGSPLQFGDGYVLTTVNATQLPFFRLDYIPPGLAYYFLDPVQITFAFPYVALPPPPNFPITLPSGYETAITGGLFTMTPIVLASCALPLLWRRRPRDPLVRIATVVVLVGLVEVIVVSFTAYGIFTRFESDFATLLVLPGVLAWLIASQVHRRAYRNIASILGAAMILFGCFVGVASSITGYDDEMRMAEPNTYWTLQRATSFLPTIATAILGHPDVVRVFQPNTVYGYGATWGEVGSYQPTKIPTLLFDGPTEVDVVAPSGGWWLNMNLTPQTAWTARTVIAEYDGGSSKVVVSVPNHILSVPLHGGVNRVTVTVAPAWSASIESMTFSHSSQQHS